MSLRAFGLFLLAAAPVPADALEDPSAGLEPVRTRAPIYEVAVLEGRDAEVDVLLALDADGRVIRAELVRSTHAALDQACLKAAHGWRFPAATGVGQVLLPFRFRGELASTEPRSAVERLPKPRMRVAPPRPDGLGREAGFVDLVLTVDPLGNVVQAQIERLSHGFLEEPALAAARRWKFEPAVRGGEPVACRVLLPMRFSGR